MESFVISFMMTVIHGFIKNPASAEAFKAQLLAIRDSINTLYPQS
jgi:hypothetical protein